VPGQEISAIAGAEVSILSGPDGDRLRDFHTLGVASTTQHSLPFPVYIPLIAPHPANLEQLARSRGRHGVCRDPRYPGRRASATERKERLVRAVASGQPLRAAARRVAGAVHTGKRAVVPARATGSLVRTPLPGCPRRSGPEQAAALRARREAAPAATVREHGAWWAEHSGHQLRAATRWRALRRLGGPQKKTRVVKPA
jgi:transposase